MLVSASWWIGPAILATFAIAYILVFAEEKLHLHKSKPVMAAAGLIWIFVAIAFHQEGRGAEVAPYLRKVLLDYAELFLFLLSAMSFVNTMVERNVFEALRTRLMASKLSVRGIYWITGTIAFFLSPIADNLTTALVMGTVVISTLGKDKKSTAAALISVVVAANAGGVFSPFGDVTTLMIWQKGVVEFSQFFSLFIPAIVNWIVPAALIALTLPKKQSEVFEGVEHVREGGYVVVGLFLATIAMTVFLDHNLGLPPFLGMMLGLGLLNLYGHYLHGEETRLLVKSPAVPHVPGNTPKVWPIRKPFDIFGIMEKIEWDTLLFFYGIMLCVGGLGAFGYLEGFSTFLYNDLGPTIANTLLGLFSAVLGNIPLTLAVLTMNPAMSLGEWLLVTLTVGVGGSLLATGSAAGAALMGMSKGSYTFLGHLKWSWAIMLGFLASIGAHLLINASAFVTLP